MCYGIKRGYYHYDYVYCIASPEMGGTQYTKTKIMSEVNYYCEHDVQSMAKYSVGKTPNQINEYWKKYGHVQYDDKWTVCLNSLLGSDATPSTSSKNSTRASTITYGYNNKTPYQCYIGVIYSVLNNKNKVLKKERKIFIDWTTNAVNTLGQSYDKSKTWGKETFRNTDSEGEEIKLSWINDKFVTTQVELLSKMQINEGLYSEQKRKADTNKYKVNKVYFFYAPSKTDSSKTNYIYDDKQDQSTHKMLLSSLEFFSGEVNSNKQVGTVGKTLLENTKTSVEKSETQVRMNYSRERKNDELVLLSDSELKENDYLLSEGLNGNIIDISSIQYSPITSRYNHSVIIYKDKVMNTKTFKESEYYFNQSYLLLKSIQAQGDLQQVDVSSNASGGAEARNEANELIDKVRKNPISFSVKTVGLPPLRLNEYVQTKTTLPQLNDSHLIASMDIDIDVGTRPMIQTTLGLNAIDSSTYTVRKMREDRKKLIRKSLDVNAPVLGDYEFE